jgi:uncharacterized protein (TIGR00369 family)
MPRMNADDIDRFLAEQFPAARGFSRIEHVGDDRVRLRLVYSDDYLRPGGTVSGPTLMTLADTAMYFLVLANVGPTVNTVTTDLSIHFLRRPAPRDVIAEASLLKLGRRLAVGDVRIFSDGDAAPVAQATVTYAIP